MKRAGAVPPLSLSLSLSFLASAVGESRRLSVYVSGCSVVGLSHVKIPQEIRVGTHASPDTLEMASLGESNRQAKQIQQ